MAEIKHVLSRFELAKSRRSPWHQHWQDLADVMRPVRGDFVLNRISGSRRHDLIYDSTPQIAVRGLASAVEDLLMPKADRWFHIKTNDEALNEEHEAKEWLEHAEERMWSAMYSAPARFTKAFAEAYRDLVTFGTAAVFIGENRNKTGLTFRSVHLKDFYILLNDEGEIDTVFLEDELTARQADQRYGRENLGQKTKEALSAIDEREGKDKKFKFLQAVFPREDARGTFSRNLAFAAIDIDVESEHKIVEGGFHEFPYAVMRWDTASGEDYGESPAMIALPDALTLNQMGKTILEAGHRKADPSIFVPSDATISLRHRIPGGVSYFDAEALQQTGLSRPFFEMGSAGDFPLTLEMQKQTREMLLGVFFKNVLDLPTENPQMTATEVIERKKEVLRTVGPIFGRLQADGPAPTVERVFGIMSRIDSAFAPAPEILQGESIRFEYQSPVERVRQSIDAFAARNALELIAPFIELDPSAADHFDIDDIGRGVPEGVSMPTKWLRSKEDVAAIREQRQKQQAAEAIVQGTLDKAEQLSKIEKNSPGMVTGEQ